MQSGNPDNYKGVGGKLKDQKYNLFSPLSIITLTTVEGLRIDILPFLSTHGPFVSRPMCFCCIYYYSKQGRCCHMNRFRPSLYTVMVLLHFFKNNIIVNAYVPTYLYVFRLQDTHFVQGIITKYTYGVSVLKNTIANSLCSSNDPYSCSFLYTVQIINLLYVFI